ncbi:hypothetical protein EHV15_05230 [Paenibacillus oralis]|uniref:ArpU family transcriptional regulator n=1 Tax=Paenibacillus oralis TaxID=2490856 RepID=A0A3P3TYR8_9BACL|nr:ArpU family phage packaging/lysis transcriptional regulator [Paenibacillus oralis]RRJ62418.1 hypothetical protein EHV15_05230 [Paenibacillus oralis]
MRAEAKDVYQLALMEINRDETRRRTEKELETARVYQKIGFVRREIKNTPNYEPREHQGTNAISKPCEDVAVWNVDNEARLRQAYERVQRGLNGLKRVERQIIEMRYLEGEDITDFQVYMELHLSERSYYRRKSGALYKMAFAMGLEVYITDETANQYLKGGQGMNEARAFINDYGKFCDETYKIEGHHNVLILANPDFRGVLINDELLKTTFRMTPNEDGSFYNMVFDHQIIFTPVVETYEFVNCGYDNNLKIALKPYQEKERERIAREYLKRLSNEY